MLKVIAFDLDNTLYEHRQYVEAAYRDISSFVGGKYTIDKEVYFKWIFSRWCQKGSSYNRIFEESSSHFGLKAFKEDIDRILKIYHDSKPCLKAFPGTREVLKLLTGKYRLVLITDGGEKTQEHKINSLGIGHYFCGTYISGSLGRDYYKPSARIFSLCMEKENIKPSEMLYIGDNPQLDGEPCKELNIRFVRLLKGEYENMEPLNGYLIRDISELPELISKMERDSSIC